MALNESDEALINEVLSKAIPIRTNGQINENTNVSGMINDSSKHKVSFELTQSKQLVMTELTECNHRTPPIKISQLLEVFFKEWPSNNGWWLYVAQNWNPRAINRTIAKLVKIQITGQKTIINPAAYFTTLIKYRKKRRS